MKTRQKINLTVQENEILDLHGNHFQVRPYYRLCLDFPRKKGNYIYTSNIQNHKAFTLITNGRKYYAIMYLPHLDLYILRKLTLIKHYPEIDIRTAYLYGKNHH